MRDKRKHTLRTHVRPDTHQSLTTKLLSLLDRDNPAEAYLADELLSKFVGPDTDPPEVRRSRAIEKWLKTETRNARTNIRLYGSGTDFGYATSDDVLEFARGLIKKILGEVPQTFDCKFSGGASTSVRKEPGSIARKFTGQADVTSEAWPYVIGEILHCYGWWKMNPAVLQPRMVRGNVMFTVPKSTVIDRVACKEPDLNMFVQLGVGGFIRRRLKKFGIDLNDQSVNRALAREGSASGKLATLDLSSASDSISISIVARLLPPDWFCLLDAIRSKWTVIDGESHENAMFSSMGNGFTFELESLIFYALLRSIAYYSGVRGRISVYGDDLIVPVSIAARVKRTFSYFGFTVNGKKSHWRGPFRESCGGHYYGGADITPFYVKEPIADVERLIHFLNRLRAWAGRVGSPVYGDICDNRFLELWLEGAAQVDKRLWGGVNLADPTQLVSRHTPRLKLVSEMVPLRKLQEELQTGLCLQSLSRLSSELPRREAPEYQFMGQPYGLDHPLAESSVPATGFGGLGHNPPPIAPLPLKIEKILQRRWRVRKAAKTTLGSYPLWFTPDRGLL